jgi:hypothetical protein
MNKQEIFRKVVVEPDYDVNNADLIEWSTECPFCGKTCIAMDSGEPAIQIEEACPHFYSFDWIEDTFTFSNKEDD